MVSVVPQTLHEEAGPGIVSSWVPFSCPYRFPCFSFLDKSCRDGTIFPFIVLCGFVLSIFLIFLSYTWRLSIFFFFCIDREYPITIIPRRGSFTILCESMRALTNEV